MRQLVIVAGGAGTRLGLSALPKVLVDICGVPLLERQILLAKKHDFNDILIIVNYGAEQIQRFCSEKDYRNVAFIKEDKPLGTAGAVISSRIHLEEDFLVVYGDIMLDVDLQAFYEYHKKVPETAATLYLSETMRVNDVDLVSTDRQNRITTFHPYPHTSLPSTNLNNAALYCLNRKSLPNMEGKCDFAKDVFPRMLEQGLLLRGYKGGEYLEDVGTPERLAQVRYYCGTTK